MFIQYFGNGLAWIVSFRPEGRCNREGKRSVGDVYIFDFLGDGRKRAVDERANLTKGMLDKYEDISDTQCIDEYYDRLFFMRAGGYTKKRNASAMFRYWLDSL